MKSKDIHHGCVYAVKVSGKIAPVKITQTGTKNLRGTNLRTGRDILIRSPQRVRRLLTMDEVSVMAPGRS